MSDFTVIYDANVLYPAPLRDLLLRLAVQDIFRARWTDRIHDEWIRNLLVNRPDLSPDRLNRTRQKMNENVRDCLIVDYEHLIPGLELPDSDDRHVLAAAIKVNAAVIVTYNLADFPGNLLAPFGIEAQHPDDFLVFQFDLNKAALVRAVRQQRAALQNPPRSAHETRNPCPWGSGINAGF